MIPIKYKIEVQVTFELYYHKQRKAFNVTLAQNTNKRNVKRIQIMYLYIRQNTLRNILV